jgi:beta-mannosidase
MKELSLNGKWTLEMKDWGKGVLEEPFLPSYVPKDPVEAQVPGEVHLDLLRAGRIEEPLYGVNAPKYRWLEEKEWWYRKEFQVEKDLLDEHAELVFLGVDTYCDVYLNGEKVSSHANMFVPLVIDVTGKLRENNLLVVRVDSGVNWVKDKPVQRYPKAESFFDFQRVWLRKAQFTFGWDFAPRLVNAGIWRDVAIRFYEKAALRNVFIQSELSRDHSKALIRISGQIESFSREFDKEFQGRLRVTLADKEGLIRGVAEESLYVYPGVNNFQCTLGVENPRLWWPNGVGEPHLYTVFVSLFDERGREIDRFKKRWGIRKVEIQQKPLSGDEGYSFIITVNDKEIFCKGADWVVPDCVIPRVSREKYRRLIDEAILANFNMLRVWGGGIYEDPFFYEYCAERGLMIWQDFMFACAYYPDDPEFLKEVEREIREVVRRLRNETSIVLWCGNNELQWLHVAKGGPEQGLAFIDYPIYHEIIPSILRELDPSRPYWPSTPYGGADPNSEERGDKHAWYITIGAENPEERVNYKNYAQDRSKFVSEFGVFIPPNLRTIKEFIPPDELFVGSSSWNFHRNPFDRQNVETMIRVFIRRDPETLSLEEYVRYAQILQAEALKFAIEHWRHRKFNTAGVLFWMFTDCWGTTGSQGIVDYYLRKNASFYHVREAYEPVHVSFHEEGMFASIYVVNDTFCDFSGVLEYGMSSFAGEEAFRSVLSVCVPANVSKKIIEIKLPEDQETKRRSFCWAKLFSGGKLVSRNRLFMTVLGDLNLPPASLQYAFERGGEKATRITVSSDRFVWCVTLDAPDGIEFSNNWFDVFPGETVEVVASGVEASLAPSCVSISWNNR